MNYYIVTLLTKGKKESIKIKAHNKTEALHLARLKKGGIVVKIYETVPPLEERIKEFYQKSIASFQKKKIKIDSLVSAIRQLAVMVNAGIAIYESLVEIANNTTDLRFKKILQNMATEINSGLSISQSVEKYRYEFGSITITLIKLGEQTGKMAEALFSLANLLENIRDNIAKFKKAIRYPITVILAMMIAFVVLITFVVPKFKSIFNKLHSDLPIPTKILLFLEEIFTNYGLEVLGVLVAAFFAIKYFYKNNVKFKLYIDKLLLKVYLIKDIIYYGTLSRFTMVFTELISSGIPIAEALDSAVSMIENGDIKRRLESVKANVERGVSLTDSLKQTELFENMIIQLISAGEVSGQLDNMMRKVSEYYDMKFNHILDNMSSYIEPILIILIAAMVLLLALGIFMPMWNMAQAVKGGY